MDAQKTSLTADEARAKIVELCERTAPLRLQYLEQARVVQALSLHYHKERLKEAFPGAVFEERPLIVELDARETPKSLDVKLEQLKQNGATPKHIIFDYQTYKYFVFL
jgi:hypothetical protein